MNQEGSDSVPVPEMIAAPSASPAGDLERILEIPLTIHVELGRRKMRISELLATAPGAVVELDTAAGAALSIYANDTLIAEGEAVVVGDRYGVRITDILPPSERVKTLGARRNEEV
jgi:flagellar motor switch protein FliN/FliY